MSYTQPGGQARPGTVSLASVSLYLLMLLSLVSAALSIYAASQLDTDKVVEIYVDNGMDKTAAETAGSIASVAVFAGAAFAIVLAIVYLVLAIFVGKGKQWARITAWVFGGLAICCNGFGAASGALSSSMSGMGSQPGIDQEKINEQMAAMQPSWLAPVSIAMSVAGLILGIALVILLLLPPSHPYFRKQEPVWTPPAYPNP